MPATTTSNSDRLGSTLFLAALAHGIVILGVTFAGPSSDQAELQSLDVTLVVDRDETVAPDKNARWLSERNERGAGKPDSGLRPTTMLAADRAITLAGDPKGADLEDRSPHDPAAASPALATRAPSDRERPRRSPDPAAPEPMRAAALLDRTPPRTRAAEIDLSAHLPDEQPSTDDTASPATRESRVAAYLDEWRRRVERIGTVNYPTALRGAPATGRPTLEVAIDAAGRLEDIVVRKSSGDPAVDQAALDILRMAAPFPPLPPEIRADHDVLRFAYEWDFLNGEPTASVSSASARE